LIEAQINELSAGSDFMEATLQILSDEAFALTVRSGEYRNVIKYVNPEYNNTENALLEIAYLYQPPVANDVTDLSRQVVFPLFNLDKDVVWGFKNPKEGKSNHQMALDLVKNFLEFLEKQNGQE
jgi:hypothetical protein